MRSPGFITNNRRLLLRIALILLLPGAAGAQRVSVITPEKASLNTAFVSSFRDAVGKKLILLDDLLSEAAYSAVRSETPLNMRVEAARNIGAAIGCDYMILIKTRTERRSSLQKTGYFESSAAVYTVSARTGHLVSWQIRQAEAEDPAVAAKLLAEAADDLAAEISLRLGEVTPRERSEKPAPKMEEMPAEGTPEARAFRSPVPYKRIKPAYTDQAYLHNVAATVDLLLDLDEKGNIVRTEIVRWAGYGLDEAVTDAVRKMNWRPAERNGKPLPLRVLLRYNFKRVEKDE